MFENLSDKLQRVFKNLRGEGKLTAENMETALREIRVALLEADVHFRVVKQLIANITEKALGEEVLNSLSPGQQVVKIVRDELVRILGTHQAKLRFANEPPSVIDRKSTRLNSSHSQISYAVFCLKKKKKKQINLTQARKTLTIP